MKKKTFWILVLFIQCFVLNSCAQESNSKIKRANNIAVTNIQHTDNNSGLSKWYGVYINSDYNDTLTNYDSLINEYGWFRLRIGKDSITYDSDYRMVSEFPQSSPGGDYINMTCAYKIKMDTLFLYDKKKYTT